MTWRAIFASSYNREVHHHHHYGPNGEEVAEAAPGRRNALPPPPEGPPSEAAEEGGAWGAAGTDIQRTLSPRFLRQMAAYDVASDICHVIDIHRI